MVVDSELGFAFIGIISASTELADPFLSTEDAYPRLAVLPTAGASSPAKPLFKSLRFRGHLIQRSGTAFSSGG